MSAGPKDKIFAEPATRASDFAFDGRTAAVFDDMLARSVPFYEEFQRMTGELAGDFAMPAGLASSRLMVRCQPGFQFACSAA